MTNLAVLLVCKCIFISEIQEFSSNSNSSLLSHISSEASIIGLLEINPSLHNNAAIIPLFFAIVNDAYTLYTGVCNKPKQLLTILHIRGVSHHNSLQSST